MPDYATDPTTDLERAAEFYNLREVDRLIAAGVTADDLRMLADTGCQGGTLFYRAIERAQERQKAVERRKNLDRMTAADSRDRWEHDTRAQADRDNAVSILTERGTPEDLTLGWVLKFERAITLVGITEYTRRKREMYRERGVPAPKAPAAKPSEMPLWDHRP